MNKKYKTAVLIYGSFIEHASSELMAKHQKMVFDLGYALGKEGFDIVTGGGVGMMGAACDGAKAANPNIKCIGIDLEWGDYPCFAYKHLDEQIVFEMGDYYSRLETMKEKSGYQVVCPGGKGTLRELFETWETLAMDYEKQPRQKKIILYPASYWHPIYDWIKGTCHTNGYIFDKEINMLELAETPQEVVDIILERKAEKTLN